MKRILVTGDRRWTDETIIHNALAQAWRDLGSEYDTVLVHGACHLGGADIIAERLWRDAMLPYEGHPARRTSEGKTLGPERNARMVALGADLCLAFVTPKSRGTRNCMRLARESGIPVRVYESNGDMDV